MIDRSDWLNKAEQQEVKKEEKETRGASDQLNIYEEIQLVKPDQWEKLSEWNQARGFEYNDIQVSLPRLVGNFLSNKSKKIPSEKQLSSALNILKEATKDGFTYI